MSLTQHLHRDLGAWLSSHAGMLDEQAARLCEQVQAAGITRPEGTPPVEHHARVGGIVGQRLAFAIEPAPPYAALLGALRCSALTAATAARLATLWPTHAELSPENAATIQTRPTPGGWWQLTDRLATDTAEDEPAVVQLIESTAATCRHVAEVPLDRLGRTGAEVVLARCCAGLDLLEGVYRSGRIPGELHTLVRTGQVPVAEPVITDAVRVLSRPAASLQALAELTTGARGRLGHAAPVIVPGWAEGDVLAGPDGAGRLTLLDVKTVTHVTPEKARAWWNQVLAYALLDTSDRWRIARIGLWLPRSDVLVTADVGELVARLGAPAAEFTELARAAVTADGGS